MPKPTEAVFLYPDRHDASASSQQEHNLELQLLPSSSNHKSQNPDEPYVTNLKLSIGLTDRGGKNESNKSTNLDACRQKCANGPTILEAAKLKELANEEMRLAMAEKAYAEEARQQAKRQIDMAELEFANAKRIRQQAQAELEKAQVLREQAAKKISSTLMKITCQACKQQFQTSTVAATADETTSLAMSYMSSATTEGEGE